MKRFRIAFGGIYTESSTFNPVLTPLEAFRVLRGAALRQNARYRFLDAYLGNSDDGADFLPTLHAAAIPGGPVVRAVYEAFKREFLGRLRALGPVDGLYLDLHGAMNVFGMDDAEGDWLTSARRVVGPDCLVAASYDLHGNVSSRVVAALDIFSAFRTAPHTDVAETQKRACTMLVDALRGGYRPQLAWVPVPVVLPGEMTCTEDEPARSLYRSLPDIDAGAGVLDASLLVGYVWADEPRAQASAVLTGTDAAVLQREARALAGRYWNARHDFGFGARAGTLSECLDWVSEQPDFPVVLSDSGDNPTGGGVGDTTFVLAELLKRDFAGAVVAGLVDAPAVRAFYAAGEGAELELTLGATLDPAMSRPVAVRAQALYLYPTETERDRQAVIAVSSTAGNTADSTADSTADRTVSRVTVVVSAVRRPYHYPADLERLGVDLLQTRLLVVKSGYLTAELRSAAAHVLLALTPGTVSQKLRQLTYRRQGRRFPLEPALSWTPAAPAEPSAEPGSGDV